LRGEKSFLPRTRRGKKRIWLFSPQAAKLYEVLAKRKSGDPSVAAFFFSIVFLHQNWYNEKKRRR
jgi:hypothetical protein